MPRFSYIFGLVFSIAAVQSTSLLSQSIEPSPCRSPEHEVFLQKLNSFSGSSLKNGVQFGKDRAPVYRTAAVVACMFSQNDPEFGKEYVAGMIVDGVNFTLASEESIEPLSNYVFDGYAQEPMTFVNSQGAKDGKELSAVRLRSSPRGEVLMLESGTILADGGFVASQDYSVHIHLQAVIKDSTRPDSITQLQKIKTYAPSRCKENGGERLFFGLKDNQPLDFGRGDHGRSSDIIRPFSSSLEAMPALNDFRSLIDDQEPDLMATDPYGVMHRQVFPDSHNGILIDVCLTQDHQETVSNILVYLDGRIGEFGGQDPEQLFVFHFDEGASGLHPAQGTGVFLGDEKVYFDDWARTHVTRFVMDSSPFLNHSILPLLAGETDSSAGVKFSWTLLGQHDLPEDHPHSIDTTFELKVKQNQEGLISLTSKLGQRVGTSVVGIIEFVDPLLVQPSPCHSPNWRHASETVKIFDLSVDLVVCSKTEMAGMGAAWTSYIVEAHASDASGWDDTWRGSELDQHIVFASEQHHHLGDSILITTPNGTYAKGRTVFDYFRWLKIFHDGSHLGQNRIDMKIGKDGVVVTGTYQEQFQL